MMKKSYPLPEIMKKLNEEFIKKSEDQQLVVAQLDFDGKKESWVSSWAKSFKDYDVAVEEKLEKLQNNGGTDKQIRFYEDLQKLNAFDVELKTGISTKATVESLHCEVANFSKGFSIWL